MRLKQFQIDAARAALRRGHAVVATVTDMPGVRVMSARSLAPIRSTPAVSGFLANVKHRWVIQYAACCVDGSGQRYIKAEELVCHNPLLMRGIDDSGDDLPNLLADLVEEICESANPNHLVGAGWMASPVGVSYSEAEAFRVFDALGVWDR